MIQPWRRLARTLPFILVAACPDRGAGNNLEALGLVYSPLESASSSVIHVICSCDKSICPFLFTCRDCHSTKKPVTTMLTYPWKCTVLHCNHLGNTWKPLVLMTRHLDYCPRAFVELLYVVNLLKCCSFTLHNPCKLCTVDLGAPSDGSPGLGRFCPSDRGRCPEHVDVWFFFIFLLCKPVNYF